MKNTAESVTNDRIRENSTDKANDRIDRRINKAVEKYRYATTNAINRRIRKLEKEWDIERTLMLNASVISLTGTILAAAKDKRWLVLPVVVTAFLAQHALQGWCPPLPVLRGLGVRTMQEIDAERYALLELLEYRVKL